ncbi:MAG: ParB/RepB/Spo0J family partition protein [Clostridia bacterium]
MPKNTGLGKGLDALFGNSLAEEEKKQDNEVVEKLKIIEVEPNKDQPRRQFDEESLEELAESIKKYGVIQPIIVTKRDNYYQIVAGERRWRACKKAGLTEIPAIVRENDERKNREIALIENIQREDLNPIEKAKGFKALLDEYGMTQQELADVLGIARSSIANTIRILNLDERVINLALEGKLTEGHCKALLAIDDGDKQYDMALYMIETGSNVRDAEKKMARKKKLKEKEDKKFEAICRDIETSFQSFFGTKVRLNAGKRSGKIVIQYSTNEELERILNLIK